MATTTARTALPLSHDLTMVFKLNHAVIVFLLASSIAGLLYGPRGWWYDANPATLPSFLGQDVMTLVFAVPLLLVSAMLARRGSLRGLLCWMGALFYVAYSYYFYVIGGRFNVYFPLYVALVSMGTYGALAVLFSIDLSRLPAYFERLPVRLIGGYLIVTSLAFAGLWLSILDAHYVAGTVLDPVSRAVIAIDGVVLLPLLFYGGRALLRREPVGYALAGLLLVKAVATFLTLLINTGIAMRWGRSADPFQTTAYGIGLAAAATLLVWYLRCITTPAAVRATVVVRTADHSERRAA
jgi:hypothetical protein